MSGKRRLSNLTTAQGLAEIEHDEFESTNLSPFGGIGRRKSSLAPSTKSPMKGTKDFAKQEKLAEKYRMIIQLSSENKINAKNSWNLDLIDNMSEMIMGDASGSRGVNFQKASCTIDASVKIYSHRVDDTWTSSLRILENLSRNAADYDEDDDEEGGGGEDGKEKSAAKVGSKSNSKRLDLLKTIEKNIANINAVKIENQFAVDPMFQKMSKAFDEGGAKGMLMSNLRVAPNSSCIVFSATGLATTGSTSTNEEEKALVSEKEADVAATETPVLLVDLSYLLSNVGFTLADLVVAPLCPILDDYRRTIGVPLSSEGVVNHTNESLSELSYNPPVLSFDAVPSPDRGQPTYSYDDDNNNDAYDGQEVSESGLDADPCDYIPRSSLPAHQSRRASRADSAAHPPKFSWNAVFGEEEQDSARSAARHSSASANARASVAGNMSAGDKAGELLGFDVSGAGVTAAEHFSFYDMSALHRGNDWAGAKHWKLALRARAPKTSAAAADDADTPTAATAAAVSSKTKKTRKEKEPLLFTLEPVEEALLAADKSSTVMTAAALKKAADQAKSKALNLPPDAKLEPKDLCRLFLRPRMLVMPAMLSSMLKPKAKHTTISNKQLGGGAQFFSREEDLIWGDALHALHPAGRHSNTTGSDRFALPTDYDEDERAGAAYVYEADDDDNCGGVGGSGDYSNAENVAPAGGGQEERKGLQIRLSGMAQASRTVQKIDIGYATSSKRVNVGRLKKDLWTQLDDTIGERSFSTSDRQSSSTATGGGAAVVTADSRDSAASLSSLSSTTVSFRDVVAEVATAQNQSDITVSFYFICLLHLANEKNLVIEDCTTMDDLVIGKGV